MRRLRWIDGISEWELWGWLEGIVGWSKQWFWVSENIASEQRIENQVRCSWCVVVVSHGIPILLLLGGIRARCWYAFSSTETFYKRNSGTILLSVDLQLLVQFSLWVSWESVVGWIRNGVFFGIFRSDSEYAGGLEWFWPHFQTGKLLERIHRRIPLLRLANGPARRLYTSHSQASDVRISWRSSMVNLRMILGVFKIQM